MEGIVFKVNEKKKYNTIQAVVENRKSKKRASVELGLSLRQINRLVKAYQERGALAFIHGNRGKQPLNKVDAQTRKNIVKSYDSFITKPNFKHFTEILAEDDDLHYSDTTIRHLLYEEGIFSPKSQKKTKRRIEKKNKEQQKEVKEVSDAPYVEDLLVEPLEAHPSRPRKKYKGELVQMDASSYLWFGGKVTHLHLAIDDASGEIIGGYFDTQETLKGYYHVFYQLLKNYGIPATFLTDRRTVFIYESTGSKKMEEDTFTQFGFACSQLGVEIKTTSVPEAKGRVERLNATVQSRLPVDLERLGIQTIEEANHYLPQWLKKFNKKFSCPVKEDVFEKAPSESNLNLLLARVCSRVVDGGHHILYHNGHYLPTKGSEDLYFTKKSKALVIEAFNGEIYLNIANEIYTTRQLLDHELVSTEFDAVVENKKERRKYIPPQSHPWKLASFKRYLHKLGKSMEDYQAEQTA